MLFPEHFTWGAATASYQIEGSPEAAGKGPSVWDKYCEEPGRIWDGHHGRLACDHYQRYREDVGLMSRIGLQGYRLSLSWPRILPAGTGKVNEAGLDFYDRLVDELLAAGVQPWVTLFHWDYPYELFLRGGWLNPDSPQWFADYTAQVVDRLSDRVSRWITLNEPQVFIGMGHKEGTHAPGMRYSTRDIILASHNTLKAHGLAVRAIRAIAHSKPSVSIAPVGIGSAPATNSSADVEAARASTFAIPDDGIWNSAWWMDPVLLGNYPEAGLKRFERHLPSGWAKDLPLIAEPLDFLGVNIYVAGKVRADASGQPEHCPYPTHTPYTLMHWKWTPDCLYWLPRFFHERYRLPIVITENGMSSGDIVSPDGRVHDMQRIEFLRQYLGELGRAIADGVRIDGYFLWSLMDNFEWAEGYRQRFGLIHVDYETQRRTIKESGHWYSKVIATRGASLSDPEAVFATPRGSLG
jgi:beta-glucosidase